MATGPARFVGIPVAAYRDNSVKRVGNSHVIAFCRVGSATQVEHLSDGSLYSVINNLLFIRNILIFYLHDVGKLCKRIVLINNEVEAVGLL